MFEASGGTTAAEFALSGRDLGYFLGLVAGEGSFGGDGRQPQLTIRMHTRHEALFHWLERAFPGSGLYGPYHHGGRSYYQWMARGPILRSLVVPLIATNLDLLDDYVAGRFREMCERYGVVVDGAPSAQGTGS